jgi:SHS2 domain-containing protein
MNGHVFRKATTTRHGYERVSHFRCKRCGLKVRTSVWDNMLDIEPHLFHLDRNVRAVTYDELVVRQVHES